VHGSPNACAERGEALPGARRFTAEPRIRFAEMIRSDIGRQNENS
jgi:hypothetical protein